jgi:hypothetical protein
MFGAAFAAEGGELGGEVDRQGNDRKQSEHCKLKNENCKLQIDPESVA